LPGARDSESSSTEGEQDHAYNQSFGTAGINFARLGIPRRLSRRGIIEAFRQHERSIRYGGLTPRQRWRRRFDDDITHLSILPIGLFEAKAIILPRIHLPQTKEKLLQFCRRLIDRGEDEQYINLVLEGWPSGWRLEHHVELLWSLRDRHRGFYEDVLRGRHGRALVRLEPLVEEGELTRKEGQGLIFRQGLLWCAMDSQMTTCGARASMIMPFGLLVNMTMKVFKGGTALRLMSGALDALDVICGQYQTAKEDKLGQKDPKPKGPLAKALWVPVEKAWARRGRTLKDDRADLDDGMTYIRNRLPGMRTRMSFYHHHQTGPDTAGDSPAAPGSADNRHRHFHAIWYSNLSPAAGMAVGLIRLVMAERHLAQMIRNAAGTGEGVQKVQPLPPLPTDVEELRAIENRVLDLAHAARRIHLQDHDWKSRSRGGIPHEDIAANQPVLTVREPLDKDGFTFLATAFAFLEAMGQRPRDAHVRREGRDHRIYTYWKMDCIPEIRLGL